MLAGLPHPRGADSKMALPPQPSHRNVAEASAGKSHPLLPPPELPLFRSRKRMDRKGLTGGGSLPARSLKSVPCGADAGAQ